MDMKMTSLIILDFESESRVTIVMIVNPPWGQVSDGTIFKETDCVLS